MKNYKISGGRITNREDGTTVDSLTGKLTAVAVTESEKGLKYLNLVLTDGENQSSLRVKLYGDASMKILRCLYGGAATLTDGPLSISLEEREDHGNLIHLTQNGRELVAVGSIPPYTDLRAAFIQRLLITVKGAVEGEFPVAVLTISGAHFDDPTVDELCAAIAGARPNGRNVTLVKRVFTTPAAATAFLEGAAAISAPNAFITGDPVVIETLKTAVVDTEPAPADSDVVPEDNEEV